MGTYFSTINTGLSGLKTQRKSLDVTGHNIANANNEDYSRQRAVQSAKKAHPHPGMNMPGGAGQVGRGAKVAQIERIRDDFLDNQIREGNQEQGRWNKISEGMERIELILNEPSDSGLSEEMDQFWESLQDLSNNPEDSAARSTVQQRAISLADTFNSLDGDLENYKRSLNEDVDAVVDEVNSLTRRIADLNDQISSIEASGNQANDLIDKRNALFNELNEKVNVQGRTNERNELNVSLSGVNIVSGNRNEELFVERQQGEENKYQSQIKFETTGNEADIRSGELSGILELRDDVIDDYRDELGNLAKTMGERFNEVHQQGYDSQETPQAGGEFFSLPDDEDVNNLSGYARDISVSDSIQNNINRIAAGNHSDDPRVATVLNENIEDTGDGNFSYQITVEENPEDDSDYLYTITEFKDGEEVRASEELEVDQDEEIDLTDIEDEDGNPFSAEFTFTVRGEGEANISPEARSGSGANATALARVLKDEELDFYQEEFHIEEDDFDSSTVMEFFESTVSRLGVEAQRSNQMVQNQEDMMTELKNRQESISGVSLDEEMSNLIKYQQAYSASAQVITTSNQMIDSLFQILR